jgi:ribonuclease E
MTPVVEPQVPKPPRRPAEVRRPSSDWDRLAEDLGVPVQPRPVQETPPSKPVRAEQPRLPAAEPVAHFAAAEEAEVEEPETTAPAKRPSLFEGPGLADAEPTPSEMWESEIPELSDPLFLDAPSAAAVEGEAEGGADAAAGREQSEERERVDRKRGRRRRRGRRRGSRPAEGTGDAQPSEAGQQAPSAGREGSESDDSESASSTEEEGAAPGEGRTRRRRRHRGSDRHRKPEAAETAEPLAGPADAELALPPAFEGPDVEADEPLWDGGMTGEADESDEDDDADDQVAKLSHRAIPTWEEAIKFVIAPNLEARAKHPNGGQQHRGGRRSRGGDRSRRS